MRIIDLLNKIANGEEVRFEVLDTGDIFSLKKGGNLYNETYKEEVNWYINEDWLNYGVKIIEEKKIPEKIKSNGKEFYCDNIDSWIDKEKTSAYCEYLMNKYNDLIDYLNSKGE